MDGPARRQGLLVKWLLISLIGTSFCAVAVRADLIHRYSFHETGIKDSVGNADGAMKGASIVDGKLVLKNDGKNSGDDDVQFVEFSKPILPKTGSVSLVFWFTASDAGAFSRLIDLGDQDNSEGRAFIYFTARDSDDQSRAAISATDAGSKTNLDNDRLDDGEKHMVALVIDGDAKKFHVFIDGKEPTPAVGLGDNTLDKVSPKHAWIGRSAFDTDPGLSATVEEFRVYDNALSATDVAAAMKAGPGALPSASTQPAGTK
jgi:hypothetical protein